MKKRYVFNFIKDKKIICNIYLNDDLEGFDILKIIKQLLNTYNAKVKLDKTKELINFLDMLRLSEITDSRNEPFDLAFRGESEDYMKSKYSYGFRDYKKGCFAFVGILEEDKNVNKECGTSILLDFDKGEVIGDFFDFLTVPEFEKRRNYTAGTINIENFPLCPVDIQEIKFNNLDEMIEFIKKDQNYYFRNTNNFSDIYMLPKNIKQY